MVRSFASCCANVPANGSLFHHENVQHLFHMTFPGCLRPTHYDPPGGDAPQFEERCSKSMALYFVCIQFAFFLNALKKFAVHLKQVQSASFVICAVDKRHFMKV